mmetsp:Transcript_77/g.173  ORF Transcript_77/g.173 Transcript_77/m.173 type:complete len:167 (-) Transcript_77:44-544(-)
MQGTHILCASPADKSTRTLVQSIRIAVRVELCISFSTNLIIGTLTTSSMLKQLPLIPSIHDTRRQQRVTGILWSNDCINALSHETMQQVTPSQKSKQKNFNSTLHDQLCKPEQNAKERQSLAILCAGTMESVHIYSWLFLCSCYKYWISPVPTRGIMMCPDHQLIL